MMEGKSNRQNEDEYKDCEEQGQMDKGSFVYKKLKSLGILSTSGDYSKELNLIQFGQGKSKKIRIDLRTWVVVEGEGEKMCKGICLTRQEAERLFDLLSVALMDYQVNELLKAEEEGKQDE